MKFKLKELVISIAIPLAVGLIFSILSRSGMVYKEILKPFLSPPGFVFPIVWTILYVLMGISSLIIYNSSSYKREDALKLYIVQLFVNGFWTVIFFNLRFYFLAFLWIILLIVLVVIMFSRFYNIDKKAAYLQIPYLIWLIFALYLSFGVFVLN